ncbi:MAG: cupin [Actinobacteria bacterium]|nr:MAG: cupin [Actinomycetota bacterium]
MTLEVKNIDKDADVRAFEHGKAEVAKAGNVTVGRATLEPGWRWSNDVKPIAKTDSCQVHHKGYVISGRIHVVMDDGAEGEAGHDAWVVGDKPYVAVDFSEEIAGFAKPS